MSQAKHLHTFGVIIENISQKQHTMLIEFSVANYLSFKDKKTLSLEATAIKEFPENVIDAGRYKLLRSVAIYGANSSGKSNLIKAMEKMEKIISNSGKYSSTDEIEIIPFLLNPETENKPSFFEILILIEGTRYRYGFEVDRKSIQSEWLYECKASTEKQLFIRDNNNIEVTDDFPEGKGVEEKTRDNALFLSMVDQNNGVLSKKIMGWFKSQSVLSGLTHESHKYFTSALLNNPTLIGLHSLINKILNSLDLGFTNFKLIEYDRPSNKNHVLTQHNRYDNKGNIVESYEFDLLKQESSGTNKLYDLAGHLAYSLWRGSPVFIDELDAKLHPLITIALIKLFNSPEHNKINPINKTNAQLIFATHDSNLLTSGNFRRDQIYFTEKDRMEATDLYSLVEYKEEDGTKVRNDRSFEKDYIEGRYGAIPYVGDFSKL